jgi:hypothetical protein
LDLLRISSVRNSPDEQISRAKHPAFAAVDPGVVIRLSSAVIQLECESTHLKGQPVLVKGVRGDLRRLPPIDG